MTPTFWTWSTEHWWLAFWLAFWAMYFIAAIVSAPFGLAKRWLRSGDIRARGWPPAHLDTDGDFNKADDE